MQSTVCCRTSSSSRAAGRVSYSRDQPRSQGSSSARGRPALTSTIRERKKSNAAWFSPADASKCNPTSSLPAPVWCHASKWYAGSPKCSFMSRPRPRDVRKSRMPAGSFGLTPLRSPAKKSQGVGNISRKLRPRLAYIPTVVENEGGNRERTVDIYSRLLRDRRILIGRPIDDVVANLVVAQLMYLAADDPEKEIQLYVNSPGGAVTAGLAIYDTMQYVRAPISTLCIRRAASFDTVVLMAGGQGKRLSLASATHPTPQPPNSRQSVQRTARQP